MTQTRSSKLPRISYMSFPFRINKNGAETVRRFDHIRDQVEQVIFTSPGERVFRPEFGFGARRHVFEPNSAGLWEYAQNRLYGALAEALTGEVDPQTIQVTVGHGTPEVMLVRIRYVIAALQKEEIHEIEV